ncbi:hypothetical protein QJS10_CPB04g00640 [Acorus calamus]|uniref:FHA domain-containing protein n=1 Tax=Acorus calamus TaxID=4465 RepID=A0AAV9F0R0_ACOCL|nr:hypothetical protein QJS10_CPB04g00640 [Acorus calamus]
MVATAVAAVAAPPVASSKAARRLLCFTDCRPHSLSLPQRPLSLSIRFESSPTLQWLQPNLNRTRKSSRGLKSSPSENPSTEAPSETWLLEPVGDGDSKHIGFRVPLPGAFEIVSNVVTVGRLAEKADMVIPVATVSGLHARLEKKEGALLVTDLDSTNGTFINDKKLKPGDVTTVSPGSCVTFGDMHLAIFRVSKLKSTTVSSEPDESESQPSTDGQTELEIAS